MLQYTARITSTDTPREGRNLVTRASLSNPTTEDDYGFVFESDKKAEKWLFKGRDYTQAKAGDTVTLSLLIRCDKSEWGASEWAIRVADSQGTLKYLEPNEEVFGAFHKHVWTFDLREDGKLPIIQLYNHIFRKDKDGNIKFNKRVEARYIKLERGTIATDWTPAPEDVAESVNTVNTNLTNLANTLLDHNTGEIHKLTSLLGKHKQDTDKRFDDLNNRSLTADQRDDVAYLTNSLQVLRSAGNNTLEGLALQRIIALSGDNQTVTAYLASNAMPAVLKAGITDFGTPQEREQVEITHQGSGHFGNLYFAGDTIDFRTDEHTDPYLSIGAEEATFIETFLGQARLDDTPITASNINLTPTSTGYQRTITTDNDGTRLTITLDRINIATFDNTFTRLTLDDETLAEWRGTLAFREEYRNGILTPVPVRTPYEATGLTYERVVRAGTHTLRLQIINPQSPYTATINGLKVRRRYDTGAQQSLLTKSGLRLFGSPDRYLDVDYRQRYTPNGGQYTVVNPYLVRIKGGAKIDKLTAEELDMPGVPLCGATFSESGVCINSFGAKAKQQGSSSSLAYRAYNADFYRVYHSIGHKNYIPVLQVYGLSNGNYTQCLTTRIDAIEANSFAVRVLTTDNVSIKHSFSYVAFKTTE